MLTKSITYVTLERAQGGSLNARDEANRTLLHAASYHGHVDIVRFLIDQGAAVNSKNDDLVAPLYLASQRGQFRVAKILIQRGNAQVNALTRNKWTALHKACEGGHLNVVKLLIENGASVNIENICEWRALHIACCYDHMSVACYLIENGANVNAPTNGKETPFHKVCEFGESVEMLRALIRYGADVNALNYQKCNGLHFAAANGNTDIVLELIKNGLNMNALNEMNKTPLGVASECGNISCALQLLCFGASISKTDVRDDKTKLLGTIQHGLEHLREEGRVKNLLSEEEAKFLYHVAFCFAFKHSGNTAFNAFSSIRSFITYHGVFMAPGFDRGKRSIWTRRQLSGDSYSLCPTGGCTIKNTVVD